MHGPLVTASGEEAQAGSTTGYWLDDDDFVSTSNKLVQDFGPIGFPRDWPTVYSSSAALKSLIGKRGRCASTQVVVLGEPTPWQLELVEGVRFQPLQSFANAERAQAEAGQLQICRGWAVFEHLGSPMSSAFMAERFWWNALPDGTWVDFTPRPKTWPMLLVALAADGAPKQLCQLTPERAWLANTLFASRFGRDGRTSRPSSASRPCSARGDSPSDDERAAAASAGPRQAGAARSASRTRSAAGNSRSGDEKAATAAAPAAPGPPAEELKEELAIAALKEELAQATREADEACTQLRALESEASELRARVGALPSRRSCWSPPEGAEHMRVGSLVRIGGLKDATDLNGQEVTLASWDQRTGRWKVRLRTGEARALLPGNLELLDEAKDEPELTTFGCEIIGRLPVAPEEVDYHLWPLVLSGLIRVRVSDQMLARLNVQFDRLYADSRSASHAPFLQGEMREGRQLTVKEPDREYVSLLLACAEKLGMAANAEDAKDFEYKLDTVWTVHQLAGDYNPVHFHNNGRSDFGFSSFLHLQLPQQLNVGQAWLPKTGSKGYHDGMTSFIWRPDAGLGREHLECPGSLECELAEGWLYVFPQWVQHFVWPFRGPGERRTVAANISLLGPSMRRPGLWPAGGGGGGPAR